MPSCLHLTGCHQPSAIAVFPRSLGGLNAIAPKSHLHIHPCRISTRRAVMETPEPANAESPPKRRRVDWQWECPACSNKHPTSTKLLVHMSKCCGDLITSSGNSEVDFILSAPQQAVQTCCSTRQSPGTAPSTNHDDTIQQLLKSACEQEQKLRMQALRLRFIAEEGLPTLAFLQPGTDQGLENGVRACPDATQAPVPPLAVHSARFNQTLHDNRLLSTMPSATLDVNAAAAAAAEAGAVSQQAKTDLVEPSPAKRRARLRSSGRVPVRSVAQVAAQLQLPEPRVIKLLERAPRSIQLVADREPVEVVYEDDVLLAICKPAGLRSAPIHRFMGGSAVNRMIGHLGREPHLLHRLDMDTSGLLLATKDAASASALNVQFQAKEVHKAYLALCLGVPQQQNFTVNGPIGQHPTVAVARRVSLDGQQAVTHVQVLSTSLTCPQQPEVNTAQPLLSAACMETSLHLWGPAATSTPSMRVKGSGCCLVCCRPVTGRTHQIRVHMAHAGHPLLGDTVYGLQGPWIGRQALHAVSLTFCHPTTDQPMTIAAPVPEDFMAAAAALGLKVPPVQVLMALSSSTTRPCSTACAESEGSQHQQDARKTCNPES